MKIYVITKGAYAHYRICAATIDAEKAERLKRVYSDKGEETRVEIIEDGEGRDLNLYWVCNEKFKGQEVYEPYLLDKIGCEEVIDEGFLGYVAYLYAKDKNQAREKAKKMIARYKGQKKRDGNHIF